MAMGSRHRWSATILCRCSGKVYHLTLEGAAHSTYTAPATSRPAIVAWPSPAALAPVRNAAEVLVPKVERFFSETGDLLLGQYKVSCSKTAIIVKDAVSSAFILVQADHKNAELCTRMDQSGPYVPVDCPRVHHHTDRRSYRHHPACALVQFSSAHSTWRLRA
jgi:hypothetical protein